MGLFSRKKDKEEEAERPPAKEVDREAYVKTKPAAKKTEAKTEKKPTTKKEAAAEKKPAKKTESAEKKAAPKKETAEKKTAKKTETSDKATEKKAPAEKKTSKKEETPAEDAPAKKPTTKTWHITKDTEKNQWKVKAEENERATKYFNTKAEAEEYVKTLLANNEGSKVIAHKKDGKFQKK